MNDEVASQPSTGIAMPTPQRHGEFRIPFPRRFPEATGLSAAPLFLPELAEASAHFPIAFVGDETPEVAAVLAIAPNDNLFVDAAGVWRVGAYIPAILRRRPFGTARTDKADTLAIVIDENDATLSRSEGVALFEDEKPSALTQELTQMVRELQGATAATAAFARAVKEAGLLAPRVATLSADGVPSAVVQGLQLVDGDKLLALPDPVVADWHRRGYLAALAFIMGSQGRWQSLLRLAREKSAARA